MLLSIDIGIKNLSFCIFQEKEIVDWGIIDLSESDIQTCRCGNTATLLGNEPYCTKHKPKKSIVFAKTIEKMKLVDFKKVKLFQKCHTIEECKAIAEDRPLLTKKNASAMDLIQISRNIQNHFDEKWKDTLFDTVIIENQISPLASRMKSIQGMVTQYFVKTVPNIQYISSSNKLKHVKVKMTYQERKKEGIRQCEESLPDKWRTFFANTNKKDDLSDCYLQGIWFITKKLENKK